MPDSCFSLSIRGLSPFLLSFHLLLITFLILSIPQTRVPTPGTQVSGYCSPCLPSEAQQTDGTARRVIYQLKQSLGKGKNIVLFRQNLLLRDAAGNLGEIRELHL